MGRKGKTKSGCRRRVLDRHGRLMHTVKKRCVNGFRKHSCKCLRRGR